ncbi:MAG: hypothetical protein IPH89_13115 [Bacteroidetes bacterium]|nr:hypothetical protein [Bacteroidota bacterium]
MNYKKNKLFIIGVLAILLFTTCKKYEEGPCISLYSKEHRVVGEWDIEYLGINGYDSTDYFRNSQTYGYYSFSKYKDGRKYIFHSYLNGHIVDGFWGISSDKTYIVTVGATNVNIPTIGALATGEEVIWYIKRLTEKEMWLESTFESRTFYVKYKQK